MSRVTSDVETAQRFLSNGLVQIISIFVTFTATLFIMLSHHAKLTFMAMIPVPLLAWRVQVYSTKVRPMFWDIQQQIAVLTARLQENITGQRVVKAFARKDYEMEIFERDNMALLKRNVKAERLSGVNWALMRLLTEISLGIILWYGGWQVISGHITYGTLVAFNMWLGQLLGPIRRLGFWVSLVQRTIASGERIFEILDTKAEVEDKPGAKPMPPVEGRVTFEGVSFSYDGEHMVLDGINLDVKPGQTIAVLGGTGSGKSTLINLIPRFYDVTKGRILIDGVDIRDVTLESLRRQIGIVTQRHSCFQRLYATTSHTVSLRLPTKKVMAAAKAAHIHDFIVSLPQGYDSVIGERGVGLSGARSSGWPSPGPLDGCPHTPA